MILLASIGLIGDVPNHVNFPVAISLASPIGSAPETIQYDVGVNIIDKVRTLSTYPNIQLIYAVSTSGTTFKAKSAPSITYIWGDSNNLTPVVQASQFIPFLDGSTGRWVAHSFSDLSNLGYTQFDPVVSGCDVNITWLYLGKNCRHYVNSVDSLKYVHISGEAPDQSNFIVYNPLLSGRITIPSSWTTLQSQALRSNNAVTSIDLPSSISTYLGDYTFYDCTNLVYINNHKPTVYAMGGDAFTNCPNLTTIHVPIGSNASYAATFPWNTKIIIADL